MNAVVATIAAAACAPSHRPVEWHQLDWSSLHRHVRRLQARIVKATQEGRWGKVKALQRLLTTSFAGKSLAVRRVTENQGKRTPGVDRVKWSTPETKARAIGDLGRRGYQPLPLRRIYIPKANGKMRPLSIPTMKDRAMQALHLLALDPVVEVGSDRQSYGFRRGRSAHDAMISVHLAFKFGPNRTKDKRRSGEWVLEADIEGCFNHISHDWLLAHVPMDKAMLQKWLAAGFMEQGVRQDTTEGTPQGGIISPVLMNCCLNGLDGALSAVFPSAIERRRQKVNLVRYADDFVITGASAEMLEMKVKPAVERFLAERGLRLSPTKTKITHIEDGFDFLGFTVRSHGGKVLIKPSQKSIKSVLTKTKDEIKRLQAESQQAVIQSLNPIVRGWSNYFRHEVSAKAFQYVDHRLWRALWQWAKKRHPNKGAFWLAKRYWRSEYGRKWRFGVKGVARGGQLRQMDLFLAAELGIRRHTQIKAEANPYDPKWRSYFEERTRRRMTQRFSPMRKDIYLRQDGRCPTCREMIEEDHDVHHLRQRQHGGGDEPRNLVMLHPNCHRQHHSQESQSEPAVDDDGFAVA